MTYQRLDALPGCRILKNEPMSGHTSFQIGGPADRMVTVYDMSQLQAVLAVSREEEIPLFLLGRGSNILVSDRGYRGIVLRLDGDFKEIRVRAEGLEAGAGASLAALCKTARDHGLSGVSFAYGIPGSVGGALFMNAGAYGGEMKQVVAQCRYVDKGGREGSLQVSEMDLGYRQSRFQQEEKLITAVSFRLTPGDPELIRAEMEELMAKRRAKQPYTAASGGSTFKRPAAGYAAAMIEDCGLKGCSVGDAEVSEKHGGFIINRGKASCQDVLNLVAKVQETVQAKTGVLLECEIRRLGD